MPAAPAQIRVMRQLGRLCLNRELVVRAKEYTGLPVLKNCDGLMIPPRCRIRPKRDARVQGRVYFASGSNVFMTDLTLTPLPLTVIVPICA